jgi:hypothetical protein
MPSAGQEKGDEYDDQGNQQDQNREHRRGKFHSAQQAQEVTEERPQDAAWRSRHRSAGGQHHRQRDVAKPRGRTEVDADGAETGFYLVTVGEGRRLAQLLRAKRKQIKKSEPIRCVVDTANDPKEISR